MATRSDPGATAPVHEHPTAHENGGRRPGRLSRWSSPLALVWSAATSAWALAWAFDVLPHPFGDPDAAMIGAVFNATDPSVGTAFTLALGLIGTGCAIALLRARRHPPTGADGRAVEILAWLLPATTALVLIHGSLIAFLGYTPVVLTLGWSDPDLQAAYRDALALPETQFLLWCSLGALLWAAAALTFRRWRRALCLVCGRAAGWTSVDEDATRRRALRTGRVAVAVAVVSALVYPAVRLPWMFGIPAGMDAASWAELQARDGAIATGVALGTAGLVGAVLILGLVQGWGVRFPRWMVGLSGRRVPVALAVVPASLVALALVSSGRGFVLGIVTGAVDRADGPVGVIHLLPLLAMVPWGLALAVATAAYALRRRATCATCGQGEPEVTPEVIAAVSDVTPRPAHSSSSGPTLPT